MAQKREVPPPIGDYCNPDGGENSGETYPGNQDHAMELDLVPKIIGDGDANGNDAANIPTELDPGNDDFGKKAATEPLWDETFDAFEIMDTCLFPTCGVENNCPFSTPGLLIFEVEHVAFRTAALFKTSWGEVGAVSGACTIID